MSSSRPLENALDASLSSDSLSEDDGEEGWQDEESDEMPDTFVSLYDDEKFDSVTTMFQHCKAKYDFDIWEIQQKFDLDFIGLVKLVNYIRKSVAAGDVRPDLSCKASFEDDFYLLPVLESDAVLYNLEEILMASRTAGKGELEELKDQMAALQSRFDAYRDEVSKFLDQKLMADAAQSIPLNDKDPSVDGLERKDDRDADYFHGYSFNAIHETMLKDRVRTDAYRDFIYDNKDIFQDKVVLDVGCGTGILSMFCAKAGAKQVIAVDNSNIIHTAREIIRGNGLDDRIQCIKGKVEEVQLPVGQVDIIVSEWMGYCLLFESMLDSVIYARDRYLAPGGLMVPSHAALVVAPVTDSDIRQTHINYWADVYGFDMRPMIPRASEECLIRTLHKDDVSGEGTIFKMLDLHKANVRDLSFVSRFQLEPATSSEMLDGFVIWFDTFFTRSSNSDNSDLSIEKARTKGIVTLSTSPYTEFTHWEQGVCFVDRGGRLLEGKAVHGTVAFNKSQTDSRGLDIQIQWQIGGSDAQTQSWRL